MKKHLKNVTAILLSTTMLMSTCFVYASGKAKWTETETADGWILVTNEGGASLGYSKDSGVELIEDGGFAFKDLNRNGDLDVYEDWRLDADTRARDLAKNLTAEEAAGLMVHPSAQTIKDDASDMTELLNDGARTVLSFAEAFPTDTQVKWNNAMQAHAESLEHGIPVSISTNPRTMGVWPDNLGLAATFDPDVVYGFATSMSVAYRALGITTLLGPQIDLSTDPRWSRIGGTFGEDPALSRDMTDASVSGHQSTLDGKGKDLGWGADSVNAMIKHWTGDGAGEGGRESHDWYGQFEVYPGGQFETHLIPFVDGGLNPNSKTETAAAVMTSYSISWSDDEEYGELVGSGFSKYKIDLLRSYGFDGVICTDWGITGVPGVDFFSTGWGVDGLNAAERCYASIMAGADQIGGLSNVASIIEAYEIGVEEDGEDFMLERFRESARRILQASFQVGLFENPYVSAAAAKDLVGGSEWLDAGYDAQLKTIVMLKNDDTIKEAKSGSDKPTVYIPLTYRAASSHMFYGETPASAEMAVDLKTANQYFNVVTDTVSDKLTGPAGEDGKPTVAFEDIIRASEKDLADCDYALVFVDSPANVTGGIISGGYDPETESFIPISLQYGPYKADSASVRDESIAGRITETEIKNVYVTQVLEEKENASYYGKSAKISNSSDLDMILYAAGNMPKDAKVIVAIDADNPVIVEEFESEVDAILMGFGTDKKAFLDVVTGQVEPSGLLPFQMPVNMEAVEAQLEDVPRDMECYVDADGNTYDFAFGLNWSGVIKDARTDKYNVPALVSPKTVPAK